MKKTYRVWVPYHTGIVVEIVAESAEQAAEQADEYADAEPTASEQILANIQRDGCVDILEDD